MQNHLAADDTPVFLVSTMILALRIHSKTHTEVGFRILQIKKMPQIYGLIQVQLIN
jgi:hypothetical protein